MKPKRYIYIYYVYIYVRCHSWFRPETRSSRTMSFVFRIQARFVRYLFVRSSHPGIIDSAGALPNSRTTSRRPAMSLRLRFTQSTFEALAGWPVKKKQKAPQNHVRSLENSSNLLFSCHFHAIFMLFSCHFYMLLVMLFGILASPAPNVPSQKSSCLSNG